RIRAKSRASVDICATSGPPEEPLDEPLLSVAPFAAVDGTPAFAGPKGSGPFARVAPGKNSDRRSIPPTLPGTYRVSTFCLPGNGSRSRAVDLIIGPERDLRSLFGCLGSEGGRDVGAQA